MKRKVLCLIVLALFLGGCSYNVMLDPNITPTVNIANQIDLKVGLFIPEEMKSFKVSDRSHWTTKYTFQVGKALENTVIKSTSSVFSSVEILKSYPTQQVIVERQLDLVVVSSVASGTTRLNAEPGFFQTDAEGSTSLSVQLTFYTPEMINLALVLASGMGITSEGFTLSTGKQEYSASVEMAVRNLGNQLVQQIYGNYDIRNLAER